MKILLLLAFILASGSADAVAPALHDGRFRPIECAARQQMEAWSHATTDALSTLQELHRSGPSSLEDRPLFYIQSAATKESLGLPLKQLRFSPRTLRTALATSGADLPEIQRLLNSLQDPQSDPQAPLTTRVLAAGSTFRMLPVAQRPGQWASLKALSLETPNFTPYSDSDFTRLKGLYKSWIATGAPADWSALTDHLGSLYASHLAGTAYRAALGKQLHYPHVWQLQLEEAYTTLPLIEVTLALYSLAAILLMSIGRGGLPLLITAFSLHTLLLAMRCAILERPPVSNMFETVIYVPWITTLVAFILGRRQLLAVAAVGCVALLALLKFTHLTHSMENVQAVLDSQYWLLIHVLMVVGSYGVFLLAGLLGHLYLLRWRLGYTSGQSDLARSILHALYIGTALIIPGTILGGVWAAQSWGRFWDWDPKESWAFISSAIYLVVVHAQRFGKIADKGLAIGSVVGLLAISFTWYGVNYILGTGLHSYGFGDGGESAYYAYLAAELLFLGWCCVPVTAPRAR